MSEYMRRTGEPRTAYGGNYCPDTGGDRGSSSSPDEEEEDGAPVGTAMDRETWADMDTAARTRWLERVARETQRNNEETRRLVVEGVRSGFDGLLRILRNERDVRIEQIRADRDVRIASIRYQNQGEQDYLRDAAERNISTGTGGPPPNSSSSNKGGGSGVGLVVGLGLLAKLAGVF